MGIYHLLHLINSIIIRQNYHCLFMPKISTTDSQERRGRRTVRLVVVATDTMNSKADSLYWLLNFTLSLRTLVLTQRITPFMKFQDAGCPLFVQVETHLLWVFWWCWAVPGARKIKAYVMSIKIQINWSPFLQDSMCMMVIISNCQAQNLSLMPDAIPTLLVTDLNLRSSMEEWWLHLLGHGGDSSHTDQGLASDPRQSQTESLPVVFLAGNTKKLWI